MNYLQRDRAIWEGIFKDADPAWLSAPPSDLMNRAAEFFRGAGAKHLLDAGSGFGRWSSYLASTLEARVTGLDSALGGAGLGRALVAGTGADAVFVAGEITALPFVSGSFDGVLAVLVLDNLERAHAHAAVEELARVASRGAALMAVFNPLERPSGEGGNNPTAGCHGERYDREEILDLLGDWRVVGEFVDEHALRAFEAKLE